MKWREYFFCAKKIKTTTLFNNSSLHQHSDILEIIRWTQIAYAVLCQLHHTDTLFLFKSKRRKRIFVVWLTQNSMRCFYLAVSWIVTSLPVFIQNILSCAPKTNEAFTGLKRHAGKLCMKKKIQFGVEQTFNRKQRNTWLVVNIKACHLIKTSYWINYKICWLINQINHY